MTAMTFDELAKNASENRAKACTLAWAWLQSLEVMEKPDECAEEWAFTMADWDVTVTISRKGRS